MKKVTLLIALLIAIFLSGEWYLHRYKPSLVEFDPELGWKLKPNFDRTYEQKTLQGQKYQAHFQTNEYGFRTYGNNDPNSLKILVLGDSFTADAFSSNEEAWFSVFAQEIEREKKVPPNSVTVWAGGAGGYGTLQELMLARKIKPIFNPDILVLQFCANDFMNNHLQWEGESFLRQIYLRRPYQNLSDQIEYSKNKLRTLYLSPLVINSRILNKLEGYINQVEFRYHGGYTKKIPSNLQKQYELESISITKNLLNQLALFFPETKKIMFNCSADKDELNEQWINLAVATNFIPLTTPSKSIANGINEKKDLLHSDGGHWNNHGNELIGKTIYQEIKQLDLKLAKTLKK